jgi:hypothetical protein
MDLTSQLVEFRDNVVFRENTKKLMKVNEDLTLEQIADYWLDQFNKYRGYWEVHFIKMIQKDIVIDSESERGKYIANPLTKPTYQTNQINQSSYINGERWLRYDTNYSYNVEKMESLRDHYHRK